MSLTDADLSKITTIVTTIVSEVVDEKLGAAEERMTIRITDNVTKSVTESVTANFNAKIDSALREQTAQLMAHSDARFEQQSVQMEDGFTHIQRQFRKYVRP